MSERTRSAPTKRRSAVLGAAIVALALSAAVARAETTPAAPVQSEAGSFVSLSTRSGSGSFFHAQYRPGETSAIGWTGSVSTCDPGTTSSAFKRSVLRRINYFRAMAGVPSDVTFAAWQSSRAQAAALMMSANGALSHSPTSAWTCFSDNGATGAGSSNLALGLMGADAIDAYIADWGANNQSVGHRRWILHPQTEVMGTGDVPGGGGFSAANGIWVFDDTLYDPRPATREEYVAWPPPGYVPHVVIFERWSFSVDGADFSAAQVKMTNNGDPHKVVRLPDVTSAVLGNTLAWETVVPSGYRQLADDVRFRVRITGADVGGETRSFAYTVTAFDPSPFIATSDLPAGAATRSSSAVALAGDFDGDRRGDILWWGPAASDDLLSRGRPGGGFSSLRLSIPVADARPIVGDFDGDGRDDVMWYAPGNVKDHVWFGRAGGSPFESGPRVTVGGSYVPKVGDFDGDGRDDVYWLDPKGTDRLWRGRADRHFGNVAGPRQRSGSRSGFVVDVDGDGNDDLFWYEPGSAADALWLGKAHGFSDGPAVSVTKTFLPAAGDFDGDGYGDVVWYSAGTGADSLWRGRANASFDRHAPDVDRAGGSPPRVADYDGDGRDDIFWHDPGPDPDGLWQGN